ncbi:MAG: hypothetical protein E7191_06425 [Erysipelotrichaceae bacterium]|nr:hypothetical protein [Erysipelotrichaceae bacterium]
MTLKNIKIITLSLLITLLFIGCTNQQTSGPQNDPNTSTNTTVETIVVTEENDLVVVMSLEGMTLYSFTSTKEDYDENDILTIEFTQAEETYPLQIEPTKIMEEKDTILSMFLEVIDDLMEEDAGLGKGDKILSLDISDNLQLSTQDIEIMAQIMKNRYSFQETLTMNYEALNAAGYIDTNDIPYFKEGLLISITSDQGYKESRFTFDASKYKGGLAAYFFGDCEAVYEKNDGWDYEVGYHAIS